MYFCYVHNWSSQNYSCPSCHKIDTFASNNVCIDRRYDLHDKILETDKLKKEIESLKSKLDKACEALEFYSNGGNSNRDIWFDEKLGYFTGKCAREALQEIRKKD